MDVQQCGYPKEMLNKRCNNNSGTATLVHIAKSGRIGQYKAIIMKYARLE